MEKSVIRARRSGRRTSTLRCLGFLCIAVLFFLGALPLTAAHGEMFVYPAKGQSKEQQSRDKYQCHQWAVQQAGFDPTKQQPES